MDRVHTHENPRVASPRYGQGVPSCSLQPSSPPVLKELAVVHPQPVQGQTENFPQLLFFPAASFASVRFSFCSLPPSKFFWSPAINGTKQHNEAQPFVYLEPFWRGAKRFSGNF